METSVLYGLLDKPSSIGIKGRTVHYDNDLILFQDEGNGFFAKNAEGLRIIGGRSAEPFSTAALCEHLELAKAERKCMCEALYDSGSTFYLLAGKKRTVLIFNRLFRSCGLGVAVAFNTLPCVAAYAISRGLFYGLSDISYSKKLTLLSEGSFSEDLDGEAMRFSDSVFDLTYRLMATIGLGPMVGGGGASGQIYSMISAASDLTGGEFDIKRFDRPEKDNRISRDTLATFLICAFSLCRRLSVRRSGELELVERASGITAIKFSFELYCEISDDNMSVELIDFCDLTVQRLEAPMSLDVTDREFVMEFVPMRADPSLSGLKAGVRFDRRIY